MSITFNDWDIPRWVARRSNGVYSGNMNTSAVFDYFVNNPTLNDCLYFTYVKQQPSGGAGFWKDLQVRIGTSRTNAGSGIWEYSTKKLSINPSYFNISTGTVNYSNHGLVTGNIIDITSSGTMPAGLISNNTYYVRAVSSGAFSFHPTLTDAQNNTNKINFTSAGSGTHYISAWKPLIVTDPTNGFTASAGTYTIFFNPPDDWDYLYDCAPTKTTSPGNDHWIRYRLTDVTGITEGGQNSTSTVKCGNYAYRVNGYFSASPAKFIDIYNQDVADGRGLIQKYQDLFLISCNIEIGDGISDCYFVDTRKIVLMEGCFYVANKGYLTLGSKSTGGGVYDGCNISLLNFKNSKVAGKTYNFYCITGGRQYLYATTFNKANYIYLAGNSATNQSEVIGCSFISCAPLWSGYIMLDRVNIFGNGDGFRFNYSPLNITPNDVCVHKSSSGAASTNWVSSNATYSFRGLVLKDFGDYCHQWYSGLTTITNRVMNIYDAIGFDITKCNRTVSTFVDCYCNEYYSLNYTITNKQNIPVSGAKLTARNGFGDVIGTSDSNGKVSIDVKVKQMKIDDGSITDYSQNVTVIISASGYETIVNTIPVIQKITDICCLRHSPFASTDEMSQCWT